MSSNKKECNKFHNNDEKNFTPFGSGKTEWGVSNYHEKPYTSTWGSSSNGHIHRGYYNQKTSESRVNSIITYSSSSGADLKQKK